jgi:hypothetical protein
MPPRRRKTAKASLEEKSQPTSKSQTPEPKTPEELQNDNNQNPTSTIPEYDPEELKQFNTMRMAMSHNMNKYQQAHYLPPSVSQFTVPSLGNQTLANIKTYIQHTRTKHMETFFQHEAEGERRAREKNEARLLYEADKNRKIEILERVADLKRLKSESEQKKHDIFIEMKKSLTNKENQAINDCQPLTNNTFFSNIGSQNMASIVTNQAQNNNNNSGSSTVNSSTSGLPGGVGGGTSNTSNLTNMPPPRVPGVNINSTMSPQYSTA